MSKKFENLVNYDICQAHIVTNIIKCPFENLVNYDICQATGAENVIYHTFENLVNYDICQAIMPAQSTACMFENLVNETDINPPAVLGRLTERGAISRVKENLRCIICVGLANHTDTTEVSNGQSKSST